MVGELRACLPIDSLDLSKWTFVIFGLRCGFGDASSGVERDGWDVAAMRGEDVEPVTGSGWSACDA